MKTKNTKLTDLDFFDRFLVLALLMKCPHPTEKDAIAMVATAVIFEEDIKPIMRKSITKVFQKIGEELKKEE